MIDYPAVLNAIRPGAQWALDGESYDGLIWLEESLVPTKEELDAAWPQVQYEREYAKVEDSRRIAYEATADPLFLQWQRGDATEQDWLDAVQAVKDAHPYPPQPTP